MVLSIEKFAGIKFIMLRYKTNFAIDIVSQILKDMQIVGQLYGYKSGV